MNSGVEPLNQIKADSGTMSSGINDDEAYGQLALAMARALDLCAETAQKYGLSSDQIPADTIVFYNYHMSNFEKITHALSELKILKDITGGKCTYALACEMADVPRLAIENRKLRPSFNDMLHYFCYHFSDFSTEYYGLNFHVDTPFRPQHGMCEVFDALAKIGYARRLGVGTVVQDRNPALSNIWSQEYATVQITDSDGYSYEKTGPMPERMRFIDGQGTPCFVWAERMRAIPADGMVWDELEGLDVPGY